MHADEWTKICDEHYYRVVQKKCTKFNAQSFCNRSPQNHAVCMKMLSKDYCLPINVKFLSIG